MNIGFLNENWLRAYPIQYSAGRISTTGQALPDYLIVAARLTTDATNADVYVSRIVINYGLVSVEFSSGTQVLGSANGLVTKANTTLPVVPLYTNFHGNVTIGDFTKLQVQASYNFTQASTLLEPTTVTVFTPPAVTSLTVKGKTLTGSINFVSTSTDISTNVSGLTFTVISPAYIASRQDKTSALLSCNNKVISGINDVMPDDQGNIDIFCINPLQISGLVFSTPTMQNGTGATGVCKGYNIPPTPNPDTANVYNTGNGDILTAAGPEWAAWPQYKVD